MNENVMFSGTKQEAMDWLDKLLKRAKAGDEKTVPELRKILARAPELVNLYGGNLAEQAEWSLVKELAGKNLTFREAIWCKLKTLRAELTGPKPTPLERLLVERVVACWLQLQDADVRYAQAGNLTLDQGDYYQRRQDRAHRRYLSAIKTLAVVRRLALPIQVDVNVAATVETTQNESPAVPSRLAHLSAN